MSHKNYLNSTPAEGKQTSYRYIPVQQTMESEELGRYSTFGIQAVLVEETPLKLISDVSPNLDEVQHLAELCTAQELDPIHLQDVVEDFLAKTDPALV